MLEPKGRDESRALSLCWGARHPAFAEATSKAMLEHIPFGWNQPNGICLLQQPTPVRAFPV
jgi:hypothetical protein